MKELVYPGQRLCFASEYSGTYVKNGQVYSSAYGHVLISDKNISVKNKVETNPSPEIGSVVIGRITRINPRFASVDIMMINSSVCSEYTGIIRLQDVYTYQNAQIYNCFRPGDIVRAVVISLGDAKSVYCSTNRNDLGVVFATSESGHTMVPISWNEMACPATGSVESRKCAKIE